MCRHFDFDRLLAGTPEFQMLQISAKQTPIPITPASITEISEEEEKIPSVVKEKMFSLLLAFSRSREEGITMNALIALGIIYFLYTLSMLIYSML